MDEATMRRRIIAARVARLATVTADGRPHLVPCCFAVDADVVYTAVDEVKPKVTLALRRIDNIRQHPHASLLVDHYTEDWAALWWIRIDGRARIAEPGAPGHATGAELLTEKYVQYRDGPPLGRMITIEIDTWRAWP